MLFDRRAFEASGRHPSEPPPPGSRSLRSLAPGLLILATSALSAGCAASGVRSVIDVVPDRLSYEFETQAVNRPRQLEVGATAGPFVLPSDSEGEPGSAERPLSGVELQEALQALLTPEGELEDGDAESKDLAFDELGQSEGSSDFDGMGSGVRQLDPDLGPMDLGYPLLVDFGAGEAPYDDGVPTIHGVELTRSGFSDSVLQAAWREQWSPQSMIHVTIAFTRHQDLGIMDGLDDTRFAWCVVGWKTSH